MRIDFVHVYRIVLFGALGGVTWQSLQPATGHQGVLHMDKLIHFIVYAGLCFLAIKSRLTNRYIWPFIGIVAFGLFIEILQGAMGWGRTASFWDMVANSLGGMLALALCHVFRQRHDLAH